MYVLSNMHIHSVEGSINEAGKTMKFVVIKDPYVDLSDRMMSSYCICKKESEGGQRNSSSIC
jgi:hypothetical protein